jgi:hypothetical protein
MTAAFEVVVTMVRMSTIYIGSKRGLYTFDGERVLDGEVGAVAHDGEDDTPWAVVNDREIFRGRERMAIAPVEVTSLAVRGDVALAGTAGARLWRVDVTRREGAFMSSFDALDRHRWGTPWGGPPETMTCALLDDGAWLAGVHVGGVWRSEDEGRTWREVVELDRDDHHIGVRGNDVVVASGGGPIAKSTDGARAFTFPRNGMPHGYGTAVAIGDDAVVLACSSGPFAKKSVLVRAARGEDSFARVHDAAANVHALAAHGSTFACIDDEGRLAFSRDSGKTWRDGPAHSDARSVVVTP